MVFSFMQNGAKPHKIKENFEILAEHFHDVDLSLNSADATEQGFDWPFYSPDVDLLDSFLREFLKSNVFRNLHID